MSSLRIELSPPEAVGRFRDMARALLEWEGGRLSDELRQRLETKAQELGVHPADREAVIGELAVLPAIQAARVASAIPPQPAPEPPPPPPPPPPVAPVAVSSPPQQGFIPPTRSFKSPRKPSTVAKILIY